MSDRLLPLLSSWPPNEALLYFSQDTHRHKRLSGRSHHASRQLIMTGEIDETAGIEAERREIEVEKRKERERLKEMERLVPGMDDEDLKALLRVFDKVSPVELYFSRDHTLY